MTRQLRLTLFGGFSATIAQKPVTLQTDKIRALLAYLAVECGRPHRRETLATLLWPEMSDAVAKRNLRQSLYRIRQVVAMHGIADDWIEMDRQVVLLRDGQVETDVGRFHILLRSSEEHTHLAIEQCDDCLQRLTEAVGLWQGAFMAGLSLPDALGFEEWRTVTAERVHQEMLLALDVLATAHERRRAWSEAARFAHQLLALEAWRESAHRQLMRLAMMQGERNEAIAQYERCAAILHEELGVEPETQTRAMYDEIVRGDFSAETTPTLHNFPTTLTPFIGRDDEIAAIQTYLHATRLLTLVGAGGMGKTRLAIAAAERLAQQVGAYADGIYFVPLAAVTTVVQVEGALASVLNLALAADLPVAQQLINHLATADCLLVLDNFEQLQGCAGLLQALLTQTSALRLIVTSRRPTELHNEQRLPIDGLPFPQTEDDTTKPFAAMTLFTQSARRVRPDFNGQAATVGRICRLVRGMPLALELAAGWTRLLSAEQIATEIGRTLDFLTTPHSGLPDRHRSMRALFEQTWQQLSAAQQDGLAQLSVLRGYSTLDALLTITQIGMGDLAALVEQGLITRTQSGDYFLHELLRVFAAEKLTAPHPTRQRHSDFYLALLKRWDEQSADIAPLRRALDNIRAAWAYAVAHADNEPLTEAARSLAAFYHRAGLLREGVEVFDAAEHTIYQAEFLTKLGEFDTAQQLLTRFIAADHTPAERMAARLRLGRIYELRADIPTALSYVEPALAYYRQQHDAKLAEALRLRAILHWRVAAFSDAIALLKEALAHYRAQDNLRGIERVLGDLANVHCESAEYATAQQYAQEALALVERIGFQEGIARHTYNLGVVYRLIDRYDASLAAYRRALQIVETLGIQRDRAFYIGNIGTVYYLMGEWDAAESHYNSAITLCRRYGIRDGLLVNLGNLAQLQRSRGEFALARQNFNELHELAQQQDNRKMTVRFLAALGVLALMEGDAMAAETQLARAVTQIRALRLQFFLPQVLVAWVSSLLRLNRIDQAAELNAEARQVTMAVKQPSALHQVTCNQIRILHAQGETHAALTLADRRLQQTDDEGERGDLYYERWLVAEGSADHQAAQTHYTHALQQKPYIVYKQRLNFLQSLVTQSF